MTSKLRRLCIGHCHCLVPSEDDEDFDIIDISPSISPFHALGESCSFGAHECLIVKLNIYKEKWGNENSEEEDSDEYFSSDEEYYEEERHVHESSRLEKWRRDKSDCRQCDPETWETTYLATNKMIVPSEDPNITESISDREDANSTKESTDDHEDVNSTKESTGDHEDEVLHNPGLDHDTNIIIESFIKSLGDCEDQVLYKQGGGDDRRNQEENYVGGSQSGQQVQSLNNVTTNYISSPLDSFDIIAHTQEGTLDYGQGNLEETANILQMHGAGNIAYGHRNLRGPFNPNQFQAEEVNLVQSNAEIVTSYNAEIVTSYNQVLAYFVEDYHLGWW